MQARGVAAAFLLFGVISGFELSGQAPIQQNAPGQNVAPQNAPSQNVAGQNAPEMSSHDSPATFSTKVNLVMVPVVVRDGQGKAIGTLQKEDFQLFDKGKPQVITRFALEKAGETAVPAEVAEDAAAVEKGPISATPTVPIAQRFVIYLFDDVHVSTPDLMQARNAADLHLNESLDPATRAAIFTTSGQGNLDFTDDREKLHEALMKLMSRPTIGPPGSECPDLSYYMADLIQNKNDATALQAAATEVLATCEPPPPGPQTAASAQQALLMAENLARSTAARVLNLGERDTRLAFTVLENAIRRLGTAPGDRSLILVSSGFFLADDLRFEETEIMDRAIRANVRISSLNARGLYTIVPGGDASTSTPIANPAVLNLKAQYQRESAIAEEGIMEELADGTGGRYFHNNNDLRAGFGQIAAAPEFVYLLGFSPQNLKLDGAYHALKVTLKSSRGLNLQARRGYYAPRHLADPEEDAKREIQEALFSRDELQDIPLELHMQFFKSSDTAAKIAVLARVNVRNLRFRKADGRNDDNLTILSGVFDRNGNYITGIRKVVEMRLMDSTMEKLLNSGITVRTNFDVAPGNYVIRLVVRDSEGQNMAARNGVVEIP
ncbi:MAG: VWA domain-containing protein [Bryobacterales bacterium]|nr:VWA domain-containing protein [Bryobacterales bacterium]